MAEYIEREAYIRIVKDIPMWGSVAAMVADAIPAADVAPVRHGRWDHNSDFPDRFICYGCGAMFDMWKHEQRLFSYCPNCGAKMDLEVLIDG